MSLARVICSFCQVAFLSFVLLGCSLVGSENELSGVQLKLDKETYQGGEEATLTLSNERKQRIGYNLGSSALQTKNLVIWATTGVIGPGDGATLQLDILPPGESATYAFSIPDNTTGTHRVCTDVRTGLDGTETVHEVCTGSFEIKQP